MAITIPHSIAFYQNSNIGFVWVNAHVDRMVAGAEFKRQTPPIAKVGPRTAGIDYLYPRRRPRSTGV